MSLDDSTLQITSKKHKEDRQISLSQPQAHTPTTTANMGTLTPTETSLLRKSGGNEHHDYYQLISPIKLYSSSEEETSPNHASPSIDLQNKTTCCSDCSENEMDTVEEVKYLRNKTKVKPIEVTERLKYMFPKGGGKIKTHFNLTELATHLRNSDFIMDGKEKREILQAAENLISSKAGHLEISAEINYSGPHITNRTCLCSTSGDESKDFP